MEWRWVRKRKKSPTPPSYVQPTCISVWMINPTLLLIVVISIILINHCRLFPLTAAVSREASLESSCLITIFRLITLRSGVTNKISCWKSKSLIKFLVEIKALFTLVIIFKSTTERWNNNHLFSSKYNLSKRLFSEITISFISAKKLAQLTLCLLSNIILLISSADISGQIIVEI